ncbi:hypothetical protein RMATCC62417_11873 [Rhizopus microsporus]|nr:hypothetical protein RMATCC62417_11873 [Rhizopus microsporus]
MMLINRSRGVMMIGMRTDEPQITICIAILECEKGFESNQHIKLYKTDDQGNKRLADGVGFISNSYTECLLIESFSCVFNANSSDNDKGHYMEETIKLLECTIRTLKLVMTNMDQHQSTLLKNKEYWNYYNQYVFHTQAKVILNINMIPRIKPTAVIYGIRSL